MSTKHIETIAPGRYRHPVLGPIHVKEHRATRRITARWKGPELVITVPVGVPYKVYSDFVNSGQVQKAIFEMKPPELPGPGTVIDCPLVDFSIVYGPTHGHRLISVSVNAEAPERGKLANVLIAVDKNLKFEKADACETAENRRLLNEHLTAAAIYCTRLFIVPRAKAIAARLGLSPSGWDVKNMKGSFGKCSSKGKILLSPRLIFMPVELSDYIIYHELGHLTEMNHSPAFHRLVDSYCQGREAEFARLLKSIRFPVF